MSRDLPLVMVAFAALLSKQGEVKTAQELGHITIALADLVKDNSTGSCAFAQQIVYSAIVTQLQSFQSTVEPLYRCHLALKLCGANAEWTLGMLYSCSKPPCSYICDVIINCAFHLPSSLRSYVGPY